MSLQAANTPCLLFLEALYALYAFFCPSQAPVRSTKSSYGTVCWSMLIQTTTMCLAATKFARWFVTTRTGTSA